MNIYYARLRFLYFFLKKSNISLVMEDDKYLCNSFSFSFFFFLGKNYVTNIKRDA